MKTGEVIASYQLEARLGEDDSRAWRARHMVSGQLFRLDLWPITVEAPAYIRAMKAIASLRHQFISSILEFGVHDGELGWTVTHLVSGPTLQERIHERGRPPYRAGLELCFAVARALESAHGHGVYHGQLLLGSCVWADDRILLTGWGQVHIDEAAKLEAGKADIDFMGVLTSTMTETPPAPVRALIDTPPKTSGAYRRALAAALGAVASSDPSTLVPSPPLEATSATALRRCICLRLVACTIYVLGLRLQLHNMYRMCEYYVHAMYITYIHLKGTSEHTRTHTHTLFW